MMRVARAHGRLHVTHMRDEGDHVVEALEETFAIGRGAGWDGDEDAALERLPPAAGIFFVVAEEHMRRILAYPHTIVASHGIARGRHPHPRTWGAFPGVLGHHARDVGLFTLEEAVRRMTPLPADRFGLAGRGRLLAGAVADLAPFDPAIVQEAADFETPARHARGIDGVRADGRQVWTGRAQPAHGRNGRSRGPRRTSRAHCRTTCDPAARARRRGPQSGSTPATRATPPDAPAPEWYQRRSSARSSSVMPVRFAGGIAWDAPA